MLKNYLLHVTREDAENSALERKLKKEILSKAKLDLVKLLTLDELQTISAILISAEERLSGGK